MVGRIFERKSREVAVEKGRVVLGHGFQVVGKMFEEGSKELFGEIRFEEDKAGYLFRSLFPGKMTVFSPSSYSRNLQEGEEVSLSNATVLDFGGWCLEFREVHPLP